MTKKLLIKGYIPKKGNKGYQPIIPSNAPASGDSTPPGGYAPKGTGESPTNTPAPPGDE